MEIIEVLSFLKTMQVGGIRDMAHIPVIRP